MATSNNNQVAATILAQTIVTANLAAQAAQRAEQAAEIVEGVAPLASPAFTGIPTAPTPDAGNNSTQLATTAYLDRLLAVANGIATLDASGLIPADQLPSLALTTVYTVSSQAAMLALPADPGDLAVRTDINQTFILAAEPASVLANWTELLFSAPVTSVAGLTGTISAAGLTAALNVAVGDSGSGGLQGLVGAAAAGDAAAGKVWGAGGAFVAKADLASPAFTGVPTTPTAAVDTNTSQIASVAFVLAQAAAATPIMDGAAAVGTSTRYARADHIHPTDTSRAPLASPTFTGTPAAPTASPGTNSTQLATTAYADAIAALKANLASPAFTGTPTAATASPGTNTTQLATTAYADAIAALKANLASPTFTGTPAAPTAANGTNTTQLATTAFVAAQVAAYIGVSLQAYDANTAKTNVAQTFTAPQRGTVTPQTSLTLNLSTTNNFDVTPTGTGTLTFSNPSTAVGQSGNIWLDNSSGYAISADSLIYISTASLALISGAGVYWLSYYVKDATHIAVSNTGALT